MRVQRVQVWTIFMSLNLSQLQKQKEKSPDSGLIFATCMTHALSLVMKLITKALQMTNTVAVQASAMMNNPLVEFQLIYCANSHL